VKAEDEAQARDRVMRLFVVVAVALMPNIAVATSERSLIEPVKSETTKQLVFAEDQAHDALPASTQVQSEPVGTQKKHRTKKVQIKTKRKKSDHDGPQEARAQSVLQIQLLLTPVTSQFTSQSGFRAR
jgi:hypothetical protein